MIPFKTKTTLSKNDPIAIEPRETVMERKNAFNVPLGYLSSAFGLKEKYQEKLLFIQTFIETLSENIHVKLLYEEYLFQYAYFLKKLL